MSRTPEPPDPIRTVTDGRLVIGEIFESEDDFRATGPDGEDLGVFDGIPAARSAITQNRITMTSMAAGGRRRSTDG